MQGLLFNGAVKQPMYGKDDEVPVPRNNSSTSGGRPSADGIGDAELIDVEGKGIRSPGQLGGGKTPGRVERTSRIDQRWKTQNHFQPRILTNSFAQIQTWHSVCRAAAEETM